jgi:hypothetical protein
MNASPMGQSLKIGRHGIDGHLVGRRQDKILLLHPHGPRARTVAGKGAIHHGEKAGMNLLLDCQKVDHCLVDNGVRPMAPFRQQPAERVLHRAGDGGEDMGLDRGQVDDIPVEKQAWHLDSIRVDLVKTSIGSWARK